MSVDSSIPRADPEPLDASQPGAVLEVCQIDAQGEDEIRLKRMGICPGRRLQLVQAGDPLIVRVVGCRVGVSRRLARCVLVQP